MSYLSDTDNKSSQSDYSYSDSARSAASGGAGSKSSVAPSATATDKLAKRKSDSFKPLQKIYNFKSKFTERRNSSKAQDKLLSEKVSSLQSDAKKHEVALSAKKKQEKLSDTSQLGKWSNILSSTATGDLEWEQAATGSDTTGSRSSSVVHSVVSGSVNSTLPRQRGNT